MPYSPTSPTRRRRSSAYSLSQTPTALQMPSHVPTRTTHSRRSSQQSQRSLGTPRPGSAHSVNQHFDLAAAGVGDGLGNLADELGESWYEDEYVEDEAVLDDGGQPRGGDENQHPGSQTDASSGANGVPPGSPSSPSRTKARRRKSANGSLHSAVGHFDAHAFDDSIPPAVHAAINDIASLANPSLSSTSIPETSGSDTDVFSRVISLLQDLGSQASVETSSTRLSTTYTALTAHLTHQSRLLTTVTHPLISPLATPPSIETIDIIAPSITRLIAALPTSSPAHMPALRNLHSNTAELVSGLSILSDSLHMIRQTSNLASRKLRTAKEAVEALRREADEREEASRWLEEGQWDRRLSSREAKRVCGEVVSGFEEACGVWRERLVELAGANGGMDSGRGTVDGAMRIAVR